MIENCHWGKTVPTHTWCPWNLYRTSDDILAKYSSVVANLQTTIQWAQKGLSKPGCWAHPDGLQVGVENGPHGKEDPGLSFHEARSHFSAWCIVSAPLVISHDLRNETVSKAVWPIIANTEAIAINQAWHGHSGSPFESSLQNGLEKLEQLSWPGVKGTVPSAQYFYKPLSATHVAVLLMNHNTKSWKMGFAFKDVPGVACSKCKVRDVWSHKDLGALDGSFTSDVASHDSVFLVVSAVEHIV